MDQLKPNKNKLEPVRRDLCGSITASNFGDVSGLVPSAMELHMHLAQGLKKLKEVIQWELEELWAQLLPTLPCPQQVEPEDQQQYV